MFDILSPEMKSLAVRTKVQYAPHPYVWMSKAHAMTTGLGIESEGLELPLEELPEWEESKIKVFPVVRTDHPYLCPDYLLVSSPLLFPSLRFPLFSLPAPASIRLRFPYQLSQSPINISNPSPSPRFISLSIPVASENPFLTPFTSFQSAKPHLPCAALAHTTRT